MLRLLPKRISFPVSMLPRVLLSSLTEIRLRLDSPVSLTSSGRNLFVDPNGKICRIEQSIKATEDELRQTVAELTSYSMYAYDDTVRNGFIPVGGGARAGICGEAVRDGEKVMGFRKIYSINIRIPRFIPDFAEKLADYYRENGLCSTLVLSAPAGGKTTFLRSIAYLLAHGAYPRQFRVGIVDERCEIFLPDRMSALIDCVSDIPKAKGIELLTRSMSPEVIICDELSEGESGAVTETQNSGVYLIASAHAPDVSLALKRPFIRKMCENGIFPLFVTIKSEDGYEYDIHRA